MLERSAYELGEHSAQYHGERKDATHEVHFSNENTRNQGDDLQVGEQNDEASDLIHDAGLLEDGDVRSIVTNHLLGRNDEEQCNQNGCTHDDNAF